MKINTDQYVKCGYRKAWVMFDLDNGHSHSKNDFGKGYLWVFSTRKEAREHKKSQKLLPSSARLSEPKKIIY